MTSDWKKKKKLKNEQAKRDAIIEAEKDRIRRYNRHYRVTHRAETAARQRRWRQKKATFSSGKVKSRGRVIKGDVATVVFLWTTAIAECQRARGDASSTRA
ncbi:hypothetical protein [Candidatus Nitrososphaera sp. FF02]|uniref:hypothetical protein n=1 Tax=Candidatus Nitrososphaera sp. FF02 TaxID=3398226 RepID=UPI0039EC086D